VNNLLCIPARLNSKRLPGKCLLEVNGKSLLQRAYENCKKVGIDVLVFTDGSRELAQHCSERNIEFLSVYNQIAPGGSYAILSSLKLLRSYDNFVNVQADSPDINPETIYEIVKRTEKHPHSVATAHYTSNSWEKLDKSHVKLVLNDKNKVLYFSRENIPHNGQTYHVHIGIYGFSYKLAKYISSLNLNNPFESESLEQLHWLYHDIPVYTIQSNKCSSINTQEDFDTFKQLVESKEKLSEKSSDGCKRAANGEIGSEGR